MPAGRQGFIKIIIIGAVVVIIAAAGYFVLTQESEIPSLSQDSEMTSETDNWKIYRNEEYGFEVKYPEDWFIKANDDIYIVPLNLQIAKENGEPIFENVVNLIENHALISISSIEFYEDKTVEEIAIIFRGEKSLKESIFIGGKETYKVTLEKKGDNGQISKDTTIISVFLENLKNKRLLFQIESASMGNYQEIFNQILSTFKFIE